MQVISVQACAQQGNFPVPEITAKYTTPDNDYLANRFASTITGPYKQDIAMVLQGQKGSGKSYASLRIAYNTARRVAEIRDGDWREWPRYFSMENVAIIDPDRASSIIAHAKPYNIYIFDDIGVGWNSRAFASKENRDKNDIFQINRVAQTIQILSMPNQFLLDKVPRMLCNYLAEMDSTSFSKGLSTMKVFRAKTVFRLDNLRINPHLVATTGEKIVKHVIVRPPKFLAEQYDKIRQETTQKIIAARAQGGEAAGGDPSSDDYEEGLSDHPDWAKFHKKTKEMYRRAQQKLPNYEQYRLSGMSHKEALKEVRIAKTTWKHWEGEGVLEWFGVSV